MFTVIHTSDEKITEIDSCGTFDDCLFFSHNRYVMTMASTVYTYNLELDEDKVIEAYELYDEEIIQEISERIGVDLDVAGDILAERDAVINHCEDCSDLAEDDWWIQAKQGECAKKMGFEAVEATDEQGTVFIVPMIGRENDLKLVSIEELKNAA